MELVKHLGQGNKWFFPKSNKIKVINQDTFLVMSDNGNGYLIYGDNNGFENPPRSSADTLKIEEGIYSILIRGSKDETVDIQLYLLLYDKNLLSKKIKLELNEEKSIQLTSPKLYKLAFKVEGNGKLEINNILLTSKSRKKKENSNLTLNRDLYNNFINVLPRNHTNNYQESVDKLSRGNTFTLRNFGEVTYLENVEWLNEQGKGRGFLRLLNGFVWLGDFTEYLKNNKDTTLINKSLSLIFDWYSKNPYLGPRKNMGWHDETTAVRLLNLVSFVFVIEKHINKIEFEKLCTIINEHVLVLESTEFYAGNNNHGMFQSFALLTYAYLLGNQDSELIEIAKGRLIKYFNYIISSEGVHKEHTPVYHYIIAANLKKYSEIFMNIDKEFGLFLNQKYKITLPFSYHIIKPNGYFPQIGDNENKSPTDMGYINLYEDDYYKYAITKGEKGIPPMNDSVVFKDSGYAIFRDKWSEKDKATYLLFNAAYHTDYHKHSDDLSFILYSEGDIFIDSGPYGYEYKDRFTQYGYSSQSHNTLIVDNTSLPRVDNKYDRTKIMGFCLTESYSEVTGINKRYSDVVHQRTVRYDKNQVIKVIDSVISDKSHKYDLHFHLAEDIVPLIYDNIIFLYRNDLLIGKMEFTSSNELNTSIVKGIEDQKNILGWHFEQFRYKKKVPTIIINSTTNSLEVETKITLYTKEFLKRSTSFIPYYENEPNSKQFDICINYSNKMIKESLYTPSRGRKPIQINFQNYNWNNYPINENSYKFRIHTIEGLEHLAKAFRATNQTLYLNKGIEIFKSWFNNNSFLYYPENSWSYYDQGTALRVLYLLEFLSEYEKVCKTDENLNRILYKFFVEHKSILETSKFYKFNNNHGMFQDVALISIILKYPNLDDSKMTSLNLGINRLFKQIRNTISSDGIHKEHSPEYQLQIYNFLYKVMRWLSDNGIKIEHDIIERIEKMPLFFAYMLKPNRTLPLFGDTTANKIELESIENYKETPELLFIFNKESGHPPKLNMVSNEAGYFVFRNTLQKEKQIYMAGIVNFNSKVHKHPDNLSFELYAYGKDIIVDSGKYSYSRSEERSYMLSNLAHNTLLVNNKDMILDESNIGKSKILYFNEWEDGADITISNCCFNNVNHTRKINFNNNGEIILLDEINSEDSNDYSLLFHLSPEFTIKKIDKNTIWLNSEDNIEVVISQEANNNALVVEDSIYSRKSYEVENNQLVRFNVTAKNYIYKTIIKISKD
ncbi:heparinase II/III family protein [Paucisalibacillus sp. EB02]|uniref:heparinase II/III domain-containing protein n=1 Tax=Paucisalibacillus sp. EB02 TaxID=1347087 RepID=UPI0004BB6CA8|nr:heparinase II/III family protein [Paucisalibacillus sp. EB02]